METHNEGVIQFPQRPSHENHVERIDGVKIHLNRLTDLELDLLEQQCVQRLGQATGELLLVQEYIGTRRGGDTEPAA